MGGIEFELCDKSFVAVEQTGPKGNPMWRYPEIDDEEHREIEPLKSELPESILIAGNRYQFGKVRTRSGGTKPFSKSREIKAESDVDGVPVKIHCRVTKRRNGMWYFWLKIDPVRGSRTLNSSQETETPESTTPRFSATNQLYGSND